jgi:hypothetical protein
MKASFYSSAIAFAASSGIVLTITPVAAHVTRDKPRAGIQQTQTIRPLVRKMAQCAPDDRKCEVERKLKGLVFDPVFGGF